MTPPPGFRILVVDDDKLSRVTTTKQLVAAGFDASSVDSAFAGLQELASNRFDVVLSDLRMPGMDGLEFLGRIGEEHPGVDVILMTAFGSVETAVEAIRMGATDFLTKPFQFQELELRLKRITELKATKAELERLRELVGDSERSFGLVGSSQAMGLVRERISNFAEHTVPVLITGETGTGKEVVSRALHHNSARRSKPFVAVGCGNIPRDLAESELFGHEKGSFTGAGQRRIGSFEHANGGTLLLDDVDDLPLELQVKLLRVLQEGTIVRVGSTEEIVVDIRIIATTKVDLEEAVDQGRFRPDLFYRLRGLEIHLPPLRERNEDVLVLADHFLQRFCPAGEESKRLTPEAGQMLMAYPWPGNVRELRRAIESAIVLAGIGDIEAQALPDFLQRRRDGSGRFQLDLGDCTEVSLPDLVEEFERELIQWALSRSGGRQGKAAEMLSIPRTTLQSKLS